MSAESSRPILCPTDFSAEAGHALRWGGELAIRLSRPLVALYADRFLPPPHFTARQIDTLVEELENIKFNKQVEDFELARLWMARNDARNYALLGDPAARLPYKK